MLANHCKRHYAVPLNKPVNYDFRVLQNLVDVVIDEEDAK
jgi:hypothetical protein